MFFYLQSPERLVLRDSMAAVLGLIDAFKVKKVILVISLE